MLRLIPLDVVHNFSCATSEKVTLPEFQKLNGKLSTNQYFFGYHWKQGGHLFDAQFFHLI
jgi:hypothetical protein